MYKLCKTEQSAQRQRELEQQLLKMMETARFDEITVSDICTQSGFSRKAFYRYFSGKEGALYALIDHTLWELDSIPFAEDRTDPNGNLEKLTWFFQFWEQQKRLLDVLGSSGLYEVLLNRMVLLTLAGRSNAVDLFEHREADAEEYAATFEVCGLMSIVLRWHMSHYRQTPEQMAAIAADMLTRPLIRARKREE